jgi:branched-chain amino acid transport system ATP-binding protein
LSSLVEAELVCAGYGRREVVHDASISLGRGDLTAMLGHNGAGKSTLLKAMMGLIPIRGGAVKLDGRDVSGLGTAKRVDRGMTMVPQLGNVLPDLTVTENLAMSAHARYKSAGERSAAIDGAYAEFPMLKERARQPARNLSGGQRQMLALAIALLKQPSALLLDEPSLGLSPAAAWRLFEKIVSISEEHSTAVLIVEQNVRDVLRIAKNAYVMASGRITMYESAETILSSEDVFAFL